MCNRFFLGALIFVIQCPSYCQQISVSFNTLFPPSAYKQVLCAYMNIWGQLRAADLPIAERLVLQTFVVKDLLRMNEHMVMNYKNAYLIALLLRICQEQKLLNQCFIQAL